MKYFLSLALLFHVIHTSYNQKLINKIEISWRYCAAIGPAMPPADLQAHQMHKHTGIRAQYSQQRDQLTIFGKNKAKLNV